jgi:phasin
MTTPKQQRMSIMAEATATTPKAKVKPAQVTFETPRFEIPQFELPKVEVPAAFREISEKSLAQAKDAYDKFKAAAEEATDVLEDTYATASKGAADYGLKLIEISRANTNAAFDFAGELFAVKTLSEAIELSAAHARKQFEAFAAQTKELTTLAQKIATDASEPVKSGVTRVFNKAA